MMKNKRLLTIAISTLTFISIILLSVTTAIASEVTPVAIQVSISGDTLRIEATGGAGIEAVFINERRINYRVDNTIELDLQNINSANITIYAIDFAGSKSEQVTLVNPRFTAPPSTSEPEQANQNNQGNQGGTIPPPVQTNPNALTPDGQATVLDHTMNTTGQEFFTFATPAGNVFFLVIDHESPENNVYFLNAVTEQDLVALAEQAGSPITTSIPELPQPEYSTQEQNEQPAQSEPEIPPQSNSGTLLFIIIAAVALGAAYYIKVYKKKAQEFDDADDEELNSDNEDLGEELEFADEDDNSKKEYKTVN